MQPQEACGWTVSGSILEAIASATAQDESALAVLDASIIQCLGFRLHQDTYALPLLRVREIIRFEGTTRVPRVPACIRGVVNLRGNVVPVVDLAVWLGRPETPMTSRTCLLVVEATAGTDFSLVGLVIDGVNQVLDIRSEDLEPPPPFGMLMPSEFIAGMTKVGDRFAYLLDLDRLLADGVFARTLSTRGAAVPRPNEGA
jgi:purine-binding chemotaxis protein CheW